MDADELRKQEIELASSLSPMNYFYNARRRGYSYQYIKTILGIVWGISEITV